MVLLYLIIGVIVATIQTMITTKEPGNRSMLESKNENDRYLAWLILIILWIIIIFIWPPYLFFKYVVIPLTGVGKYKGMNDD